MNAYTTTPISVPTVIVTTAWVTGCVGVTQATNRGMSAAMSISVKVSMQISLDYSKLNTKHNGLCTSLHGHYVKDIGYYANVT